MSRPYIYLGYMYIYICGCAFNVVWQGSTKGPPCRWSEIPGLTPVAGLWKSCLKPKLTFPTQAKPSKPSKANPRYRKWLEHESCDTRSVRFSIQISKLQIPRSWANRDLRMIKRRCLVEAKWQSPCLLFCSASKVSVSRARDGTLPKRFDLSPHL